MTENRVLGAFVEGPRNVQGILAAIDGLTRAGVDSAAQQAMLDTLVELEELRALVMVLFNVLPPCTRCGEHLSAHAEKQSELIGEPVGQRCHACFEDLTPDDREEYVSLPWEDLTDRLEAIYSAWKKSSVPTPDPESITQKAFSFR